eukprot:51287-Eustigmatos_ZCMA.PRE.2
MKRVSVVPLKYAVSPSTCEYDAPRPVGVTHTPVVPGSYSKHHGGIDHDHPPCQPPTAFQ